MSGRRVTALVLLLLCSPLVAEEPRVDEFGDPLPTGAIARLGTLRFRTGQMCLCQCLSPDGKTLITSNVTAIHFWDMLSGRERRVVPLRGVESLSFSSDGKRFVAKQDGDWSYGKRAPSRNYSVFFGEVSEGPVHQLKIPSKNLYENPVFSPDGKSLAVVEAAEFRPGTLGIWDVATNTQRLRLPNVSSFTFSGDGTTLASSQFNKGLVTLWDASTGKIRRQFGNDKELAWRVAFSPDSTMIATGGRKSAPEGLPDAPEGPPGAPIRLWDTRSGAELRQFEGHDAPLMDVFFSPDGRTLVSRDFNTSHVWDVNTGRRYPISQADEHHFAPPVAVSPDGTTCLISGADNILHLWDLATSEELQRWRAPVHGVYRLDFTPDGSSVICEGNFQLAICFVATGKPWPAFAESLTEITRLAFSPDGKHLVSEDQTPVLRVWNVGARKAQLLPEETIEVSLPRHTYYSFASDGKTLVVSTRSSRIQAWELPGLLAKQPFAPGGQEWAAIELAPGGRWMATVEKDSRQLCVWDLSIGRCLHKLPGSRGDNCSLTFSPDGSLLTEGRRDQLVRVWDLTTGKEVPRFKEQWHATQVSFAPDSRTVAWEDLRGAIHVWERKSDRELWQSQEGKNESYELSFSADGRLLVSLDSNDGGMRCWDAFTGKDLGHVAPGKDWRFRGLMISPTGRVFGVAETDPLKGLSPWALLLIDLPSGREFVRIAKVMGPEFTFSPDGKVVVTTTSASVAFHDATTGTRLGAIPQGHRGSISALAFSADGRTLATGGADGTILLWDVSGLKGEWPPPLVTYPDAQLRAFWENLAKEDATGETVYHLLASPRQAVAFLAPKLTPIKQPDPMTITRLVADLDSDAFDKREAATRDLAKLGKLAERALNKALAAKPSAEMKRRITELFAEHDIAENMSPEMRRAAGAIRVLELLGTEPARKVLAEISRGPAEAWLTEEAREGLRRVR